MSNVEIITQADTSIEILDDDTVVVVLAEPEIETIQVLDQGLPGPPGPPSTVPGPPGATGPQGDRGNAVLYGIVNPANTVGVNGDFYINTTTNFMFGPKAAGAWPAGASLIGPQGEQGDQGIQGPPGADGASAPATVPPLMDSAAVIGTSTSFARQDHVHPSDTSRAKLAGGNAFTGLQNVGSGVADSGIGGISTGTTLNVFDGKLGGPFVTSLNPSAYIYRVENINSPLNNYSAALEVGATGVGCIGGYQTQGIAVNVAKDTTSTDDVCGINSVAFHYGSNGSAFGGFFAGTNVHGAWSFGIETQTTNGSGINYQYQPTPGFSPISVGVDINYSGTWAGSAAALGSAAILIRSSSSTEQWDVGIGFMNGSPIKTAEIQSDTNSVRMYYAHAGAHTHGIDLTGATFSGNAFASPGFHVTGAGALTTASGLTVGQDAMIGASNPTANFYFCDSGKSLNYDGSNFNLYGGSLTINGDLGVKGQMLCTTAAISIPPLKVTNTAGAGAQGLFLYLGATSATNDITTYFVAFQDNLATNIGGIRRNGPGAVIYMTASDQRLKLDRGVSERGLDDLLKIVVHDFSFKASLDYTTQGFFAQQLHDIYPEAVSVGGDDQAKEPWGVDHGRLMPLAVRAIQQLEERLAAAEARIAALESQ